MADLPKVQPAGVQRALMADVPTLRFEDLAVGARGASNIGDALFRMSQSLFKEREPEVQKQAMKYAIDNPLTAEQWAEVQKNPDKLEAYFSGQGKVFKETFMQAQAAQLSSELQAKLENEFDALKKGIDVNAISPEDAVQQAKDKIDGYYGVVSSLDPQMGLKFKASASMRGASVYEKAVNVAGDRIKIGDELTSDSLVQTMNNRVSDEIDRLRKAGLPVDVNKIQKVILEPHALYAAKHRDTAKFYDPAYKAFRAGVVSRIKEVVNSPAAVDNPMVFQEALQKNTFRATVNVDGEQRTYDLQAEWSFLNDEEKKSIREDFNAAFNSRYNVVTKSNEVARLESSRAAVEFGDNLYNNLSALNKGDPGVTGQSITQYVENKKLEFKNTAGAVNSPEIIKSANDAEMVVYKQFITDFVQSTMTEEQQANLVLGKPAGGKDSAAIDYIFSTKDVATRVALQNHLRDEIKARNEFRASEDRRKEDIKADRAKELVQTIFEKPRGSKDVKDALRELKKIDSVKWTEITKAFTAGRTQDDPGVIRRLQIARARGELTTDMVISLASNLTINSQEQYFGYALTTADKENDIALTKARGQLKYTKDIAASINKTAADIEAQNAYIAVETEYNNRYLSNRKTIGTKDFKPWNATEEMDKLLAGAVKDKEAKVIQNARSRVDSFRNTYLPKDKKYTDDEIRRQIQLSISKQPSDIKTKLSPTDLNLFINDLNSLKGSQ